MDRVKKLKKLCPHFHLSLQSGSDSVLKRMNRKYTTKEYENVVEDLRKNIKDVSITTDIIVGFPGETDEEFNETFEYLKRLKLTKTHVFKYSPREGTKAAAMPNQIDSKVKDERSKKLLELSDLNEMRFLEKMIGGKFNVLVEEKKDGYLRGFLENYVEVHIEESLSEIENISISDILEVEIIEAKDGYLVGKVIK